MSSKRPPRIRDFDYRGVHAYCLTICTVDRRRIFLEDDKTLPAREQLLRTAANYRMAVIAYCFMPDHLHALVEGLTLDSDFRKFVSMYKQRSTFACRLANGSRLWQEGYYERVLRDDETYLEIVAYILNNPVRAGLCEDVSQYRHVGSDRYSLDDLGQFIQTASLPWQPRP